VQRLLLAMGRLNHLLAHVSLKDTISGFKAILEGELDDLPEQAFYMMGSIDEVRAQRLCQFQYELRLALILIIAQHVLDICLIHPLMQVQTHILLHLNRVIQ
jgi:hypothetical protein